MKGYEVVRMQKWTFILRKPLQQIEVFALFSFSSASKSGTVLWKKITLGELLSGFLKK